LHPKTGVLVILYINFHFSLLYVSRNTSPDKLKDFGKVKSGWEPQCFKVKDMLTFRTVNIEKMKNFYNKFYDEIYGIFFQKDLLKLVVPSHSLLYQNLLVYPVMYSVIHTVLNTLYLLVVY
jgi:hypothetical protein